MLTCYSHAPRDAPAHAAKSCAPMLAGEGQDDPGRCRANCRNCYRVCCCNFCLAIRHNITLILRQMPVGEDGDQVFQVSPDMFIHHRLTFISRLNKWSAALTTLSAVMQMIAFWLH